MHKKMDGKFKILNGDAPELRTLELMGYVLTTDRPGHVMVNVIGHCMTDDGRDFYCKEDGDHERHQKV